MWLFWNNKNEEKEEKKNTIKFKRTFFRVKQHINLKELEKLGFVYKDDVGKYISTQGCSVNVWNRQIIFERNTNGESLALMLYILFEKGIIEKIEVEEEGHAYVL